MAKDEAEAPQTLGAYSGLDGQPLEMIEDKSVTVVRITTTTRRLRDDPEHKYSIIVLDDGSVYHSWSEYLWEQLEAVPANALPGQTVFRKVTTDKKREVWKMD